MEESRQREANAESELVAELRRLFEHKGLLMRAQKRGAKSSFISETYTTLLSAFDLKAENFRHADRILERAIQRAIQETLVRMEGFEVGDEVVVHRSRPGRLTKIQNGLLYIAHEDGLKPRNSNHITADNAIRLETARREHQHGLYKRRIRETRPFRIYDVIKSYDEMEELEFLSALSVIPHVCQPCSEQMREIYNRRFKAGGSITT